MGSGDYLEQAVSMVSKRSLGDHVTFRSPVRLECLPHVLTSADIGLIPNRASTATHLMLPAKLLEYATLGIPIVAARLDTISYYFDQRAVRFFEPEDPADLASAILDLYRRPARRLELADRALAVMRRLNWEEQRKQYYEAIDSVATK